MEERGEGQTSTLPYVGVFTQAAEHVSGQHMDADKTACSYRPEDRSAVLSVEEGHDVGRVTERADDVSCGEAYAGDRRVVRLCRRLRHGVPPLLSAASRLRNGRPSVSFQEKAGYKMEMFETDADVGVLSVVATDAVLSTLCDETSLPRTRSQQW